MSVGSWTERIFLLGMTDANQASSQADQGGNYLHSGSGVRAIPPYGWADPRDESVRFFVGDELGRIRIDYTDGSSQIFPLLLRQGVWWGCAFYDYQQPFPTDARLRRAFTASLRLYPPVPVKDGDYLAVIVPRAIPIRTITVENSQAKKGTLIVRGITVETADPISISGATALTPGILTPEFAKFARTRFLLPSGADEGQTSRRLNDLRRALYTSDKEFNGHVAQSAPPGYSGPEVSFAGDVFAEILADVYRYNLQDIASKIGQDGMYHTSTKDAISWVVTGDLEPFATMSVATMGSPIPETWGGASRNSHRMATRTGRNAAPITAFAWRVFMPRTPNSNTKEESLPHPNSI